eukprot:3281248-Pyramimonas_sp.AAC.1
MGSMGSGLAARSSSGRPWRRSCSANTKGASGWLERTNMRFPFVVLRCASSVFSVCCARQRYTHVNTHRSPRVLSAPLSLSARKLCLGFDLDEVRLTRTCSTKKRKAPGNIPAIIEGPLL